MNAAPLTRCRICGNDRLEHVVDLGQQFLTGVFPKTKEHAYLTCGPLQLVKCDGDGACGLLQLAHSYDLAEMYGENYGYRSGLNRHMVEHLRGKIEAICSTITLRAGDLVIDIGANDGTSLGFYPDDVLRVGVDPSGAKFQHHYKPHVRLIPDFFSAPLVAQHFPGQKAKIVTSFSMLYDLESPLAFARDIAAVLDPEGIWVFEQSYMPLMLQQVAFDTICHEHLEYYGLHQIEWVLKHAGLKLIDVTFNDINGGSFSVTAAPVAAKHQANETQIAGILQRETEASLHALAPYVQFSVDIRRVCDALIEFVRHARSKGKRVAALGASTKGNVLLQYCGFTDNDIAVIGEVNPDKFGAFTPGTKIPIAPEHEVLAQNYDYLLVLPWHFRSFFLSNPAFKGQHLLFPLPQLEVVVP
jgi:NDP-4-keto-2,6-dideoxyhexose 3-C-methyltransferase